MEVLNTLLEMEWQTVNNAEALLQVEESGNKIARLQGICAGFRKLKSLLEEKNIDFEISAPEQNIFERDENGNYIIGEDYYGEMKLKMLEVYKTQAEEMLADFAEKGLGQAIQEEEEDVKNRLFLESEKGRDLFFYRGYYQSLMSVIDYANCLIREYEVKKAEKESELFDEDE
mgnify:FL=1